MSSAYHIREYVKDVLPSSELSARDAFSHSLQTFAADSFRTSTHPFPLFDASLTAQGLQPMYDWVAEIKQKAEKLYVLGTGGSSLGGQALVDFMRGRDTVTFIDNIDPHTLSECVTHTEAANIHWLIVSKSGGTLETVTQATAILAALGDKASDVASIITGEQTSPLRDLAEHYNVRTLRHPDLGGRFSMFSSVALIPALWSGMDVEALFQGAVATYNALSKEGENHSAASGAALQAAIMRDCPIHILMPYCDRLETLASWHKQLWAESLGKQGQGSTPVRALGTVDQHSQLQLYLEGPEDKFFTLVCVDNLGHGPVLNAPLKGAIWDTLNGKTIGDVMQASQAGTIASLQAHKKPLRVIELPTLDAYTLGALAMHFMLETVLTAHLLGIDAYDQPAVEDGKKRTRDYLAAGQNTEVA